MKRDKIKISWKSREFPQAICQQQRKKFKLVENYLIQSDLSSS